MRRHINWQWLFRIQCICVKECKRRWTEIDSVKQQTHKIDDIEDNPKSEKSGLKFFSSSHNQSLIWWNQKSWNEMKCTKYRNEKSKRWDEKWKKKKRRKYEKNVKMNFICFSYFIRQSANWNGQLIHYSMYWASIIMWDFVIVALCVLYSVQMHRKIKNFAQNAKYIKLKNLFIDRMRTRNEIFWFNERKKGNVKQREKKKRTHNLKSLNSLFVHCTKRRNRSENVFLFVKFSSLVYWKRHQPNSFHHHRRRPPNTHKMNRIEKTNLRIK